MLAALYVGVTVRNYSVEHPAFEEHFAAPEQSKILFVLGSLLYMGGGVWLGMQTVTEKAGIAPLVTAALAVVSGCGFLVLTNFVTQLTVDLIFTLFTKYFNIHITHPFS